MQRDKLHKDKGGFKVPDNYFESFENKLSKRIHSDPIEKAALHPKIDSGLKAPEDYFDELENRIVHQIVSQKENKKIISLFNRKNLIYVSGIAAMLALIFSISVNNQKSVSFKDIEIADIYAYFEDGNVELSTKEIALLISDDIGYEETFEEEFINDEELIEYLSEENIEDDLIFAE